MAKFYRERDVLFSPLQGFDGPHGSREGVQEWDPLEIDPPNRAVTDPDTDPDTDPHTGPKDSNLELHYLEFDLGTPPGYHGV